MAESRLKVILIRHTPSPEETIAMAAKLCYSPADIVSLGKKISAKDQKSFVDKLVAMGHLSPIEHATFTFAVEGISRACSHQLVRHRLASYSQQSQRYVGEEEGFDYVIPPSIRRAPLLKKVFVDFMRESQAAYNRLVQGLEGAGFKGEASRQDARFVLPNACETKIMVSMNARELLHFFNQRCCNRAQWEIRALAEEMLRLVKKVSPTIFATAGPRCLIGPCPEGQYSCGSIKEVRKKYKILL